MKRTGLCPFLNWELLDILREGLFRGKQGGSIAVLGGLTAWSGRSAGCAPVGLASRACWTGSSSGEGSGWGCSAGSCSLLPQHSSRCWGTACGCCKASTRLQFLGWGSGKGLPASPGVSGTCLRSPGVSGSGVRCCSESHPTALRQSPVLPSSLLRDTGQHL